MECLNKSIQEGIPFALYREPGQASLCCFFLFVQPNTAQSGIEFVFHPFDPKHPAFRISGDQGFSVPVASIEEPSPFTPVHIPEGISEKTRYTGQIQKLQAEMAEQELSKVVLSRHIHIPVHREPTSIFFRILHRYKDACCYWWYHPKTGHWMGATPELMLAAHEDQVEIMSLAGTQSTDANENPKWTDKEYEEQEIVTRYIRNILEKLGVKVTVDGPNSFKAGNLWHLCTNLKAGIPGRPESLIKALHPTPAVCGYPVEGARQALSKYEGYNREYYSGYFGLLSSGPKQRTAMYVNLRCLKWDKSQITLYVGGGITRVSDPEKEWEETVNKSRTMLDILDIFMD